MKITFYTLTILFFSLLLASHYSQGSNSKYPSDQRQESIIIGANESSDLPLIINEAAKLELSGSGFKFGFAVAVFEDLAVVGDTYGDGKEDGTGVAYVYKRVSGSTDWVFVKKLMADDAGSFDRFFGYSVDINGDFIIVGAPGYSYNGHSYSGAAYMFYRNQGGTDNWGQVTKLTPNDPGAGDNFGNSVALGYGVQFKTALVGAPYNGSTGAAYLFNEGIQIKKLTPPDGTVGEKFGSSVAYTDNWFNWIVIGAPGDDTSLGEAAGSAYLFERDWGSPNSWGFNGKITASDGGYNDQFGSSVAISGDTVVIGAPYKGLGAAYVFKPWLIQWIEVKKLMPTNGDNYDSFGSSVAVDGDVVAVGAYGSEDNTEPGWGYVFKRNIGGTDKWGQYARLDASDGGNGDWLGYSIDISGSTVTAGAPKNTMFFPYGSALVFDLPAITSDTDSDGVPDDQDNCPNVANTDQANNDGDVAGDVCDPDDDNDGMPDDWENKYSLDPLVDDASMDADKDGYSNLQEYRSGTNPIDPNSKPKAQAMPWIPLLLLDD